MRENRIEKVFFIIMPEYRILSITEPDYYLESNQFKYP